MNLRVVTAALSIASLFLCAYARAVAGETTIGVTINASSGTHAEAGGSEVIPVEPLPIFTIDHREGAWSLHVEGLPPIGPVRLSGGDQTRLSYLAGAVRHSVGPRTWIGIGESIFNQDTIYLGFLGGDMQVSRVVGARYEAGATIWQSRNRNIDLEIASSPSMHGAVTEYISSGGIPLVGHATEKASIFDTQGSWSITHGSSRLALGIRWFNYASNFTNGPPADQNHLLSPFVGWSTSFK